MADIGRYAAQYALEFLQRLTQRDSIATDAQLSDRIFVRPRPLLDHRDGASDAAEGFEVPQQDDSIREILISMGWRMSPTIPCWAMLKKVAAPCRFRYCS